MTGAAAPRAVGVLCGIGAALTAGATLGGGWWAVAAACVAGAVTGRTGLLVQAVATLALVGGAAGSDQLWLVPLLVAGVVATAEAGALVDRTTVAGPPLERRHAVAAPAVAAAVAGALVWLAELGPAGGVPAALVAAVAATAALVALTP